MARAIERKFYDEAGKPTGPAQVLTESRAGTGNMDTVVSSPPASGSRTPAIFGWDTRQQYIPEAIRTAYPQQLTNMSQQLFFHPNYSFSIDFFGWLPIADRLKMGINCFSTWAITEAQRNDIPAGSGMYYCTENQVSGSNEGYGFYRMTLSQWVEWVRSSFEGVGQPMGSLKKFKRFIFNFESSQFIGPGNVKPDGSPNYLPGFTTVGGNFNTGKYPNWDSVKNDIIHCETDGVERTLEACANLGQDFWVNEFWYTRRVNRMAIALQEAKDKSIEGAIITYGTSMKQGFPLTEGRSQTSLFIDGSCNVSKVRATNSEGVETGGTGDNAGNIVLMGKAYNLKGTHYNYENASQGYWYKFGPPSFFPSDHADIFVNHVSGTQNYPYLWSKQLTEHHTAEEKGYWQENRRLMRARRTDGQAVGIMRQTEVIYEGDGSRVPFPDLQGVGGETPKLFQTPVWGFDSVVTDRFLKGNDDPGNGYYSFPIVSPNEVVLPLSNAAWNRWNHHLHTYVAHIQGRMYLQRLERWFTGSTLIEDPDVKIDGESFWRNYDGVGAFADGSPYSQKPCSSIRFKVLENGDIEVAILIGMNQAYGTSRTDEVRAPGGSALGGNSFKLTYSGPITRVISALIPAGTTGQVIDLGNVGVSDWEPAGYAGRTEFA